MTARETTVNEQLVLRSLARILGIVALVVAAVACADDPTPTTTRDAGPVVTIGNDRYPTDLQRRGHEVRICLRAIELSCVVADGRGRGSDSIDGVVVPIAGGYAVLATAPLDWTFDLDRQTVAQPVDAAISLVAAPVDSERVCLAYRRRGGPILGYLSTQPARTSDDPHHVVTSYC